MDARELLGGDAPFVADTSAWWRASALSDDLGLLLQNAMRDDRLWITPIVKMEILYSARTSSEHVSLELDLDALRILRNDRAVADAAMRALSELAEQGDGYHRVPITDALIAAAAAEPARRPKRKRDVSARTRLLHSDKRSRAGSCVGSRVPDQTIRSQGLIQSTDWRERSVRLEVRIGHSGRDRLVLGGVGCAISDPAAGLPG